MKFVPMAQVKLQPLVAVAEEFKNYSHNFLPLAKNITLALARISLSRSENFTFKQSLKISPTRGFYVVIGS
jgi:hypothetical protein